MVKLSIIIVSYNTKELTEKCIRSITESGTSLATEIVVVDNNSSDGSPKMLRDLWREFKNIILVESSKNLGFSSAVNAGMEKATGKYILLLNSDTQVVGDALEQLVDFAEKRKDVGVVGPRLVNPDTSIQSSCYNFPTVVNTLKEYIFGIEGSYEKFYPRGSSASIVDVVVGGAFLITPKALKAVGKLDERYFMYMEDIDYCKRVHDAGLKVYYFPKAEIIHEHGASGKTFKKQFNILKQSSKIYHGPLKYYLISMIIKVGQKIHG